MTKLSTNYGLFNCYGMVFLPFLICLHEKKIFVKENSFLLDTCKHINNSTSHIEIDQKFGLSLYRYYYYYSLLLLLLVLLQFHKL